MDIINKMIYETSFRGIVANEVQRYCKGTAKCWLDHETDTIKVSILDPHNRPWTYEEYDLSNKLVNVNTAFNIAHNAIRAYEQKLYHEYFK